MCKFNLTGLLLGCQLRAPLPIFAALGKKIARKEAYTFVKTQEVDRRASLRKAQNELCGVVRETRQLSIQENRTRSV
jgi:hypothetical protein